MPHLNIAYDGEESKTVRRRFKKYVQKTCTLETVKKRLPIIQWLPTYNVATLIQDIIAGITVGLTAIPQGIAYAVVAGLPPEYGLYSSLMSGFVYLFFGSCRDITIGPTAIMSAMVAKYVTNYSADFAVLAAFLAGIVQLIMGILQLGFLVEFISVAVINGFITAAALQIGIAQLMGLFGLGGPGGHNIIQSVYNFVQNITAVRLWDTVLGFATIGMLIALERLGKGCKRSDGAVKKLRWFISLSRNTIVVVIGIIAAYIIKVTTDSEPLVLIGDIGRSIPRLAPPPFSTIVGNETYMFSDMTKILRPQSVILPLVAILESMAVAKAFAGGKQIDATQEMIALGLCNIIGSFARSMPIAGSFTRTTLNRASGVQTPTGGLFTGILIILALTLMSSIVYFIPKASLAGLIIPAMFSMIDLKITLRLWRNSKKELFVLILTKTVCMGVGLEYGLVTGVIVETCILLFNVARPKLEPNVVRNEKGDMIVIKLSDNIAYCAAEHVWRTVFKASNQLSESVIIIDGTNLRTMDATVSSNLMAVVEDLEKNSRHIICLNFTPKLVRMCVDFNQKFANNFVNATSLENVTDFIPNR